MERQSYLKLLAAGVMALGAIASLSQPSLACPEGKKDPNCPHKRKPVVTTTSPQVTPGVPPQTACAPGGGGCAQPPVSSPPNPGACAPGGPCGQPAIATPSIPPDSFFCGKDRHGKPTTFVSTPGGVMPLIKWSSHFFAGSGYNPETRCQEVSNRFDLFYRQGRLNYVTTGIVNRLPVVCVASRMGGPCTGVLFTLKPNEDASRVIQQLFDVRVGASGPLHESGERQYIDINSYIEFLRTQQP